MQAEKESRAKVVLYRIKLNIILDGWISFSGSIWLTSFLGSIWLRSFLGSIWLTSFLGSIWLRSFLGSIRSILFYAPAQGHLMHLLQLCATGIWPSLLSARDRFRHRSSLCRARLILKGAYRTDDIALAAKERSSAIMMGCQHGASPFQQLCYFS